MRIAMLAAAALLGAACYSSETPYRRAETTTTTTTTTAKAPAVFDAYTTDGDAVRVQTDARTGEMFIVSPLNMRGVRVGMVDPRAGQYGTALVTTDVLPPAHTTPQGSAGDRPGP